MVDAFGETSPFFFVFNNLDWQITSNACSSLDVNILIKWSQVL